MSRLVRTFPAGKPLVVALTGDTVIGRSDGCQLCEPHPGVSSRHCRVVRDGKDWVLEDLRSRNGTFLNDVKVEGRKALKPGDVIRCGPPGTLEVRFEAEPTVADIYTPRPDGTPNRPEPEAERLRAQVIAMTTELADLRNRVVIAEQRGADEQRAAAEAKDEAPKVRFEMQQVQKLADQQRRDLAKLQAEIDRLRGDAEVNQKMLSASDAAQAKLRAELSTAKAKQADTEDARREQELRARVLLAECNQLGTVIDSQRRELESLKVEQQERFAR